MFVWFQTEVFRDWCVSIVSDISEMFFETWIEHSLGFSNMEVPLGFSDDRFPWLQRRHNERDDVSTHQPHECLLNCLFRRTSKKTSKLRVTGLCKGNSPLTGECPSQRASDAENVFIWWRHHDRFWSASFSRENGSIASNVAQYTTQRPTYAADSITNLQPKPN